MLSSPFSGRLEIARCPSWPERHVPVTTGIRFKSLRLVSIFVNDLMIFFFVTMGTGPQTGPLSVHSAEAKFDSRFYSLGARAPPGNAAIIFFTPE